MKYMPRFLLCALCAVFLGACTPYKAPLVSGPADTTVAQQRWQAFSLISSEAAPAPARLDGSLRFGPQNNTNRANYILWSNGNTPLRLDIHAGVGTLIASVEVTDTRVVAYMPRDNRAYVGTDDPDRALRALGLPLPLSIAELNAFLQGRYIEGLANPAPRDFSASERGSNIVYAVENRHGTSYLELDPSARPVRWEIPGGWNVTATYAEGGLPTRLDGTLPAKAYDNSGTEYRFVLLVKNRQSTTAFAQSDLNLQLPQGTPVYDLDSAVVAQY